jgi:hypothetical protein
MMHIVYQKHLMQAVLGWFGWFMVFYATFKNVLVIWWKSFLLVEETGVHGEASSSY